MENNKFPNISMGNPNDIRNITKNTKNSEIFYPIQKQNIGKNISIEEMTIKNIGKMNRAIQPYQSNYELNKNIKEENLFPQNKIKSDNTIKETVIHNIKFKSKNRSMEKVPLSYKIVNNNERNKDFDPNQRKDRIKNVMELGKRNKKLPNKHNSCGKNCSNYSKYKGGRNDLTLNDSDKLKQILMNRSNRINKKKDNIIEFNNIDNLQNININQEKNKINNYINYKLINNDNINSNSNIITKSDLDDVEEDRHIPFKKYKSVCVSINNNYNYNVSLGNNNPEFIHQSFEDKKIIKNIKDKERENEWKEKIIKIYKQKREINYGDYRKLNSTDNNFWKRTNRNEDNENKNINKSSDDNNKFIVRQKIKKLNSVNIPGENSGKMNSSDTNIGDDKKNEPKKKMGILGFLRAFKDMVKPLNLRKKSNRNITEDENNSKDNVNEKLNESENYKNLDKAKTKNNFNDNNYSDIDRDRGRSNYFKPRLTTNNNNDININNKNDDINYFSDSVYDSCPIPKNRNNFSKGNSNMYMNMPKNNNKGEYLNNPQILIHSQKNILKGNINNDFPNVYGEWNNESGSDLKNHGFNSHRGNKLEERPIDNSLFNIYEIQNNKIHKKTNDNFNNNNNYLNNSDKYIIEPINDNNFNSAYIKKVKKRIFSPNRNNYQNSINSENELRKNSFLVRNNNYNINLDNNLKQNRQRIIEGSNNYKYNSENINENLNINDEKKIQEIKININYKKNNNINYIINRNNYNNSFNYDSRTPLNNQYMNNNGTNNFYNDRKLFNTMNDFVSTPKPKKEIETCIINFKQNKKQIKVYENNLNAKATNDNNNNNNNYNDDYIYNTDNNNIESNRNNNSKNIYSKPYSKNLNFTQGNYSMSDKNIMNLKIDNNNNKNFDAPPIKRKGMLHKKEKIINRLADSQEFDNDTNSISSQNSQNSSTGNDSNNNDQLNKTALFPSSVITNSIYLNSFKSFFISNKNKSKNNSGANSFFKIFKSDNNDGSFSDRGSDRGLVPGLSKSITNFNSNSNINNNNKAIYINKKSNNINEANDNSLSNSGKNIYVRKSSKNNNCKINSPINDNSAKNAIAINNITPMPDNNVKYNNIINENSKTNNIKTIIRPKVAQKKYNLSIKYYSYYLRNPAKEKKDFFCSKESIKLLKLPLKQISFYTKYYYKVIQKPLIKQNYIDKKRIRNKKGLDLPKSEICNFTKKNIIVKDLNKITKEKIVDENLSHKLNQDNDELQKEINDNNEYKEINLDKDLEEKIEILEFEKNGKDVNKNTENNYKELYKEENLDINKEIKDYNNNKYCTPSLKTENNQGLSPKFNANNENNLPKSTKNKIICFEIDLSNKDKYIKKNNDSDTKKENNLSSTYNNIQMNTNESLYVKKKPNNTTFNRNKNNLNYYSYTEGNKCKTNIRERIINEGGININNFKLDDFNGKNYVNKSNNKIISIDIDLSKENKKIQKQREAKEIKAYKRPPTLPPLTEFNSNLKTKINTIKINYNINNANLNNNNKNDSINKKYSNELNTDKLNEEIIFKLDSVTENNLMTIVDDLLNLLTKKVIIENINNNINYNKIRLSFLEILNNESSFVETIVNKAIYETKKVGIFAHVCYELSIKLTNEINFRGSNTEEDLKTILQEDCKIKFEEIILDNQCIENNDKQLFGILMFICELINLKIIALDVGLFCFEKLCKKFNESSYNNDSKKKYYFLNSIIDLINKYGKILYESQNVKYLEKIEKYVEEELNNFINNDMTLPEYLRNKIINLIKLQKNKWIF